MPTSKSKSIEPILHDYQLGDRIRLRNVDRTWTDQETWNGKTGTIAGAGRIYTSDRECDMFVVDMDEPLPGCSSGNGQTNLNFWRCYIEPEEIKINVN